MYRHFVPASRQVENIRDRVLRSCRKLRVNHERVLILAGLEKCLGPRPARFFEGVRHGLEQPQSLGAIERDGSRRSGSVPRRICDWAQKQGWSFLVDGAAVGAPPPWFFKVLRQTRVDDRIMLSGIICVIRHGLRWCDALPEYGPYKTLWK